MSWVLTLTGPVYGNFLLQRGQQVTLGRALGNDLTVDDPRVSRRHCQLAATEEGLVVADLDSANGTTLGGRLISSAPLVNGEVLSLGGVELRVVIAERRDGPEEALDMAERLRAEGFTVLRRLSRSRNVYKVRTVSGAARVVKALELTALVPEKAVSRFKQEARAQASLQHPHAARVEEVVQREDLLLIVMEYVPGETLRERITHAPQGRLSVWQVLSVGYQLGQALAHMHEQSVIHRDVNPSNVIMGDGGEVTLIDFGLAKGGIWDTSEITLPGDTLGTLGYRAPEQIHTAREADHRADIYGLGATLYHCLSGRVPNSEAGDPLTRRAEDASTPGSEFLVGVPLPLVELILSMMRTRLEDRLGDVRALLRGVEALVTRATGQDGDLYWVEHTLRQWARGADLDQTWTRATARFRAVRTSEVRRVLLEAERDGSSGVLQLLTSGTWGEVFVRDGRVVRCEWGALADEDALREVLIVGQARMEFVSWSEVDPKPERCDLSVRAVLTQLE